MGHPKRGIELAKGHKQGEAHHPICTCLEEFDNLTYGIPRSPRKIIISLHFGVNGDRGSKILIECVDDNIPLDLNKVGLHPNSTIRCVNQGSGNSTFPPPPTDKVP